MDKESIGELAIVRIRQFGKHAHMREDMRMCVCRCVHMCACKHTHPILEADILEFSGIGCFTISLGKKNDERSERSRCRTFITSVILLLKV